MTNDADRKRDVAAAFGDAADGYRDCGVLKEGADLERLVDWTAGATRALDVATGAGHVAGALADQGVPRVVAADLSPAMVATATSEYDGLEGAVTDAERLPFATDSFGRAEGILSLAAGLTVFLVSYYRSRKRDPKRQLARGPLSVRV